MLLILNPRRKKRFLLLFYFIFRDLEIFKRVPLAFLSAKSIGDGERTDGGGGSSASRKTLLTVLIDVAGGPPRQFFNLHKSSIESAGSVNTGDTLMICSPKTMEKGYHCQHLVEIGTRVGSKL